MTSRRTRVLLLAVGILLVVAACSSTDGDAETPDVTSAVATDASSTTAPSATEQTTATEQATTTSLVAQAEPLLTGANPVVQITPTEGVGLRPTLSWEAIEGAGSYFLVVKDDAGAGYWAWEGSETSVPLGGAEFPQDFGNGPTIAAGYTWSVSAYAADGTILAISGDRSLSP